jgi:hypothetical protein
MFSTFLTSCAVRYRTVSPSILQYPVQPGDSSKVVISSISDFNQTFNSRYGKKEFKAGYAAIAVKVTNLKDQPVQLTRENLKVSSKAGEREIITMEEYTKRVQQVPQAYLLHTLWGPWQWSHVENPAPGQPESTFVFLPIGLVVGIGNMFYAAHANTKHKAALSNNQLIGLTVEPGQTVYGILLIRSSGFEKLRIELKE